MKMRMVWSLAAAALLSVSAVPAAQAQTKVTGVADAEALFTDKDPKLHRNKQAALHIVKDLIEAGQWQDAHLYLTERYIQHNPMAANGRDAVVNFFTKVLGQKPTPVPAKMKTQVVAVVAQGDYVVVVFPREYPRPGKAGETYSTTWFDMWRFVDGKADEHWDPQTLPTAPAAP